MAVRAVAKNVGISPQKVRRVVDIVRGKKVEAALEVLRFLPTPAAREVAKLVKSAASNAENNNMISRDELKIVEIHADAGPSLTRSRARSRGRMGRIVKRTSHITVLVDEEEGF
ncbi:MAG: 50S ribosomal protein L22 [Chloroflexi bacterium]|nr:50S ribosomal protein L22 [Chloroflexota bacterium]